MGQVTVTLNGRTYRLSCGDGEEERLLSLAGHVRERIEALSTEFGHAGDDRLLLMAALLVTDELFDARDRLMEMMNAERPPSDMSASVPGPPLHELVLPPEPAAPMVPPAMQMPPPPAPPPPSQARAPQPAPQRPPVQSGAAQARPPHGAAARVDPRQAQRGGAPGQRTVRSPAES